MIKLKPYREILFEYAEHVGKDVNWESESGGTLLLLSTIYVCSKHNFPEDERKLAEEAIYLLLDNGADPTIESKVEGLQAKISPLDIAGTANSPLYESMINSQFEERTSTEASAFENKFVDILKKIPGVAKKIAALPHTVGEWTVDKLLKLKDPQINREIAKAQASAQSKLDEKEEVDSGKINDQKRALSKLPKGLVENDKQVAMSIAAQMAKEGHQPLLGAVNALFSGAGLGGAEKSSGENKNSNMPYRFLLDPRYGKFLSEQLSKHRAGGLGVEIDGKKLEGKEKFYKALKQMKVLAYMCIDKGYDAEDFRTSGKWKSLNAMVKIAERNEDAEGNIKSKDSSTGREIIANSLNKKSKDLTNVDVINYISKNLKKPVKEVASIYNDKKKQVQSLLEKTIKKVMKDDNLDEIFISELSSILSKSESGLTDEQESAIAILQSMGITKKESTPIIKDLEGNLEEIVREALKRIPTRGGK